MLERPNPGTFPTKRELAEPDRRLDELLEYLKAQPDGENLADWFIENLANEFRIPVVTGHRDPVRHLQRLGEAFIGAMHVGGWDRTRREALRKEAVRVLLEVMAQARYWRDETEQRSLLQRWGRILSPTAPPTSQRPGRG